MSGSLSPPLSDVLLEGERVRLRPIRPEDAEAAFPLVHRVRPVLDQLCWQGPADLPELRSLYGTWRVLTPTGDNYLFAILALGEGAHGADVLIGTAALRTIDHPEVAELSYWLGVPFHGRGFGTELVGLLAHLGIEGLGCHALSAEVFPGNVASARALERNGFRLERRAASPAPPGAACTGAPDPLRPRDLFLALGVERRAGERPPKRVRIEHGAR